MSRGGAINKDVDLISSRGRTPAHLHIYIIVTCSGNAECCAQEHTIILEHRVLRGGRRRGETETATIIGQDRIECPSLDQLGEIGLDRVGPRSLGCPTLAGSIRRRSVLRKIGIIRCSNETLILIIFWIAWTWIARIYNSVLKGHYARSVALSLLHT